MRSDSFVRILAVLLAASNLVAWFFIFAPVALFEYRFPDDYNLNQYLDALDMAVSLGRLDAISLLLTIVGIFLGVAAIFGFTYLKDRVQQLSIATTQDTMRQMFRDATREAAESSTEFLPTSDIRQEEGDR